MVDRESERFDYLLEGFVIFIGEEVEKYLFEETFLDGGTIYPRIFINFLDFLSEFFVLIVILFI